MASWGVSNPLADIAVTRFAPLTLTAIECTVGFLFLAVVRLFQNHVKVRWRYLWWIGALQPFAAWLLGNYGYKSATASTGVIILSSEAIFSLLIARLWLAHKISRASLLAVAIGIVGVALAAGGSLSAGGGAIFFLLSALLFGIYSTGMRKYLMGEDPFSVAFAQTTVSALLSLLVFASFHRHLESAPTHIWIAAIASGIFGVGLPFVAFNFLSSKLPSKVTGSALNLIPVAGVAASALLGRGVPTLIQGVGGALVLFSIWGVSRAA